MKLNTPAMRLSLALTLLTINLLFIANQVGLIADESKLALEVRKGLSESLAVQFAAAAVQGNMPIIQTTLQEVVKRNPSLRSAVIRAENGDLVAMAGEHLTYWHPPADGKSTPTHINVPIFKGKQQWATVQLSFTPLVADKRWLGPNTLFWQLLAYMGVVGFAVSFLLIRRTLRELDPKAVIPERVKKAFDILQEGVLILDRKEQIVMANTCFAELVAKPAESLIGLKGSELPWSEGQGREPRPPFPWQQVVENGDEQQGALLTLWKRPHEQIKLMVNATMVLDNDGNCRGTLVTFDDITQLEEKNFELSSMVGKLELAHEEISLKNRELESLANRDPLTLCYNRRAFSRFFTELFTISKTEELPLSCIMVDIDHFKAVNDRYGHATGDQVIKAVADVLKTSTRDVDLVGRYGGEEFCVILSEVPLVKAVEVAERIRQTMEKHSCSGVSVTLSLGVSTLTGQVNKPDELVNQADKALYAAKNSGRNRVVCWGEEVSQKSGVESPSAPSQEQKEVVANTAELARLQQRIHELEGLLEKRTLEIEHLAMYDQATGLPTWSLFEDRLTREIARGARKEYLVAVLSLGVDAIEHVHETFGYHAAEELIQACACRLTGVLRENIDSIALAYDTQENTTVSIFNTAEFGIILTDIQQVDHITLVVERILNAFDQPFVVMANPLSIAAQVGISIFPDDGQSGDELYSRAAGARRYVRESGGEARYHFSSQKTSELALSRLKIT